MVEEMVYEGVRKLARFCAAVSMEIKRNKKIWHDVANTKGAARKLKRLRRDMFEKRCLNILFKGHRSGKITPFDEAFYAKMNNTYLNALPVSLIIKYFKPDPECATQGFCLERSTMMFMCFDDAILVRGDNKMLELNHGKKNAVHGWIEIGDNVYDPTTLLKFPKDLYYKILKVSNIRKYTREEIYKLDRDTRKTCERMQATTIADFQPDGRRQTELFFRILEVKATPEYINNPDFQKELDKYLDAVQYHSASEFVVQNMRPADEAERHI